MLKRMQKDTRNPTASSHTYRSGTVLDWFPEYNDYYPVSVRIPTNQILEDAIKNNGTTIRSYEATEGTKGSNQNNLLVHTKDICPKCNSSIAVIPLCCVIINVF